MEDTYSVLMSGHVLEGYSGLDHETAYQEMALLEMQINADFLVIQEI